MEFWVIISLSAVTFGGACAILASNKNRDVFGWFVLGCLFSLVALIVIAALSPLTEEERKASAKTRMVDSNAMHDRDELRRKADELAASLAQSRARLNK